MDYEKEQFTCAVEIVTNAVLATVERLEDIGMKQSAAFGMVCGINARLWKDMQNMDEEEMAIARDVYEWMLVPPREAQR